MKRARRRLLTLLALPTAIAIGVGYWLVSYVVLGNFSTVVPGKVYRSAQPSPAQLERWVKRYGIKTVLNLRGDAPEAVASEEGIASRLGVRVISVQTTSHEMMPRPILMDLISIVESAEQPILIHCFRGVDRSGTVSALAKMAIGKVDFETAERQAFVLPGPWKRRHGSPHISDVLEIYEVHCDRKGLEYGAWREFKTWATDVYHPLYYDVAIASPPELTVEAGQAATVDVKVTNTSEETIPAGDPKHIFELIVYTNGPICHRPESTILGRETRLPPADVPPGGTLALRYTLVAPSTPGDYSVYFDLYDDPSTTFGRQGSIPRPCTLHVTAPHPADHELKVARSSSPAR